VLDKFEQERADFHERVRLAYLERANGNPSRVKVVDANQTIENICKQLEQIVLTNCL
jgi:dTMP kinase